MEILALSLLLLSARTSHSTSHSTHDRHRNNNHLISRLSCVVESIGIRIYPLPDASKTTVHASLRAGSSVSIHSSANPNPPSTLSSQSSRFDRHPYAAQSPKPRYPSTDETSTVRPPQQIKLQFILPRSEEGDVRFSSPVEFVSVSWSWRETVDAGPGAGISRRCVTVVAAVVDHVDGVVSGVD